LSRLDGRLNSGLARTIITVMGLGAVGLLVFGAVIFKIPLCVPSECARNQADSRTFAVLAVGCLVGVVLTLMPRTSSRVRVGAAVMISLGLLAGAVVAMTV